jgi:hypothetical protein
MERLLTALMLITLSAAAAAKEDCDPPTWYTSLPRDRDYYYGVARDPDTDAARAQALRNLGKQVTGDIEGWPAEKIAEVAGPCRDKWEVAAGVGQLLPKSTLLAGWEQDGFERCAGFSYTLVRVEKDRVERFVRGSDKFKKEVVASLSARLDKVESDVAALTKRLERLERGLGAMPAGAESAAVSKSVAEARADLSAGKPSAEVALKVTRAEDAYSKLEERMRSYQSGHDAAEKARLDAVKKEKAPQLASRLAKIESGKWGFPDAAAVIGVYNEEKDFEGLRRFSRAVLTRKDAEKLAGRQDFVAYMSIVADSSLKDDAALLGDGEAFLKAYPRSDMFQAVKAIMDGTIAMARMPKTAVVAPAPAPSPDPCAAR